MQTTRTVEEEIEILVDVINGETLKNVGRNNGGICGKRVTDICDRNIRRLDWIIKNYGKSVPAKFVSNSGVTGWRKNKEYWLYGAELFFKHKNDARIKTSHHAKTAKTIEVKEITDFIASGLWTLCPSCGERVECGIGDIRGVEFQCKRCHGFFKSGPKIYISLDL